MASNLLAPVAPLLSKLFEEGTTLFGDHAGSRATVNASAPHSFGTKPLHSNYSYFIMQAIIIIVIAKILTWVLAKIKQPAVIAEVITGVLLGPTVMGRIPNFTKTIFPVAQMGIFNTFAEVGLVLFMNLVGLELDFGLMQSEWKSTAVISIVGIALPMAVSVGSSYAVWDSIDRAYPSSNRKTFGSYVLFMAVAMSITAFPVLARIIKEKGLLKTRIGTTTLAVAAWDDVAAWILLALSVSIVTGGGKYDALWTFLLLIGFAGVMLIPVRLILRKLIIKKNGDPREFTIFYFAAYLVCMFFSAWLTEYFGLHSIFGAFIFGLVVPREGHFSEKVSEKFEDFTTTFFLPLYFTASGLKTQLGLLKDGNTWGLLLLILSVAIITKIVGGSVAAKISGMSWRESITLGMLMNTKGLVELIVLNIGLDYGLISPTTFSMMVVMALVTTFLTSPFVHYLYPYHRIVEFENQTPGRTTLFAAVRTKNSVGALLGFLSLFARSRPKKYKLVFARAPMIHESTSSYVGENKDKVLRRVETTAQTLGVTAKTIELPPTDGTDGADLTSKMVTLSNAKNVNFFFATWRPDPEQVAALANDKYGQHPSYFTNAPRGDDVEAASGNNANDFEFEISGSKRIRLGPPLVHKIMAHKNFKSNLCVLMDRRLEATENNFLFVYSGSSHDITAARLVKGLLHNPAVTVEIVVALSKSSFASQKKKKMSSAKNNQLQSASQSKDVSSLANEDAVEMSGSITTSSKKGKSEMNKDSSLQASEATLANENADETPDSTVPTTNDDEPTAEQLLEKDSVLAAFFNTKRAGSVSLTILCRHNINESLANHIRESDAGLVIVGSDLNWQLATQEGVIHHKLAASTSTSFLFVTKHSAASSSSGEKGVSDDSQADSQDDLLVDAEDADEDDSVEEQEKKEISSDTSSSDSSE